MPDSTAILLSPISPMEFFREYVVAAQKRQQILLGEALEFYLANLLCDFITFDTHNAELCLGIALAKAHESPISEQAHIFKQLGDTSLYFSGFFQEFFTRKSFDLSYYISMGQLAYINLSNIVLHGNTKEFGNYKVYAELSQKFKLAVDILLDVSEQTGHTQEISRSTLSLYDAWLNTASEKLEKELWNRGVFPIKTTTKIQ